MTNWVFQMPIISSSISTLNIHGVLAIHWPVLLVGVVTVKWGGIHALPMVFKWVTFITMSTELMSMLVLWCKNMCDIMYVHTLDNFKLNFNFNSKCSYLQISISKDVWTTVQITICLIIMQIWVQLSNIKGCLIIMQITICVIIMQIWVQLSKFSKVPHA